MRCESKRLSILNVTYVRVIPSVIWQTMLMQRTVHVESSLHSDYVQRFIAIKSSARYFMWMASCPRWSTTSHILPTDICQLVNHYIYLQSFQTILLSFLLRQFHVIWSIKASTTSKLTSYMTHAEFFRVTRGHLVNSLHLNLSDQIINITDLSRWNLYKKSWIFIDK